MLTRVERAALRFHGAQGNSGIHYFDPTAEMKNEMCRRRMQPIGLIGCRVDGNMLSAGME